MAESPREFTDRAALEAKKEQEAFDAKHAELREAVKNAQQELWDHVHPVIEDPQTKAQQEWKDSQKKAASKSAGPAPERPGGSPEDVYQSQQRQAARTKK